MKKILINSDGTFRHWIISGIPHPAGIIVEVPDDVAMQLSQNSKNSQKALIDNIVVDTRTLNKYFIDDTGKKNHFQTDATWQLLGCTYNDELINDAGMWRVKVQADKDAEIIVNKNIKVEKEADKIALSAIHEILEYIAKQPDASKYLKDINLALNTKKSELK